jgi:hypothetical protein
LFKKIASPFFVSTAALAGLLFISTSMATTTSSDCNNLKGCEKKFCEIEGQLKIAQEKGNKRKEDGLTKALEQAKKHCTDKGLREDLVGEIEEAKEEIAEYEADLKEAEEYGKTDKVRKYKEKIEEEKSKIKRLEHDLSQLD